MSSPARDSESFGENDEPELSLLQPGGNLLGKPMRDAAQVNWSLLDSAYGPTSLTSARILVANAPWFNNMAKPSQANENTFVLKQYFEPKANVLCSYVVNKQHNFQDVVSPADVQFAIAGMGYVMKEVHEAGMQPSIEIYLPNNPDKRIAIMYLTSQTRIWSARMCKANHNFNSRLTEKLEELLAHHSVTSLSAGGTVFSIPLMGGYQNQLHFVRTALPVSIPKTTLRA